MRAIVRRAVGRRNDGWVVGLVITAVPVLRILRFRTIKKVRFRRSIVKVVTDDRSGTNVLFDLWLASRTATAVLDEALATSGLTADEFAVYSVLRAEPLTPRELSAWMAAPPTTVSSYVRRFESRGHVRRVPHPEDGRSYRVELTAEGRRAHQRAGALFLPVLHDVEGSLGRSLTTVRGSLARTRSALDAVSR